MKRQTPAVILVSGFSMRAREFDPLTAALEARGVRATAFDNLCVGDGPRTPQPTIADQAAHIWRETDRSLGEEAPVVLFGLSMGGMIVAEMARRTPRRVRHLVLAATSANTPALPAVPDPLYKAQIQVRTAEELAAATRVAFGATTLRERPEIAEAYFHYRATRGNGQSPEEFIAQLDACRGFAGLAVYEDLKRAGVRATLISGAEDQLFPEAHGRELERYVGRHIKLPRTGHMLHLENGDGLAEALAGIAHDA